MPTMPARAIQPSPLKNLQRRDACMGFLPRVLWRVSPISPRATSRIVARPTEYEPVTAAGVMGGRTTVRGAVRAGAGAVVVGVSTGTGATATGNVSGVVSSVGVK